MGVDDACGDLVEVEVLRVDELCAVGAVVEDSVIDVGAGVDAHVRGVEQRHGAQREEVGCARSGADEVHGHTFSPFVMAHCMIARAGVQPVNVPIGAACST